MAPIRPPEEVSEEDRVPVFAIQMSRGTKFYIEKAKRTTDCRICKTPIKVGRKRVRIVISRMNPHELRNGGRIFKTVWFVHVGCMKDLFGGTGSSHRLSCIGCGKKARLSSPTRPHGINNFAYGIVSYSSSYGRLCDDCAASPRWTQCEGCSAYAATRFVQKVSMVKDEGSVRNMCRWCINVSDDVIPLRQLKADQAKVERTFTRLRNSMKKGGPWVGLKK